jgi:hypothetical protein
MPGGSRTISQDQPLLILVDGGGESDDELLLGTEPAIENGAGVGSTSVTFDDEGSVVPTVVRLTTFSLVPGAGGSINDTAEAVDTIFRNDILPAVRNLTTSPLRRRLKFWESSFFESSSLTTPLIFLCWRHRHQLALPDFVKGCSGSGEGW